MRYALLALVLVLCSLPGASRAQGPAWDQLVAAAEKEGAINVGGPLDPAARVYLTAAWAKAFPKITMQWTVAGGFEWASRVKLERAAGKYLWDIYLDGPNVEIYQMAANGTLDKLEPALILPELTDAKTWRRPWNDMFLDKTSKMFSIFASPSSIWYNAKKIDPERVKREGLEVMLDPAYKGRIAWFDPRSAGPGLNFGVMLYVIMGKEKLKTLLVDQAPVFYSRGSQVTEAVVRSRADFGIALQISDLPNYEKAGVNIDLRPIGSDAKTSYLGFGGAVLAMFNQPPNPNAAKLFANWVLTKDIQAGLSKASQWDSTRADIEPIASGGVRYIPGEKYVEVQKEQMLPIKDEAMAYMRALRPE